MRCPAPRVVDFTRLRFTGYGCYGRLRVTHCTPRCYALLLNTFTLLRFVAHVCVRGCYWLRYALRLLLHLVYVTFAFAVGRLLVTFTHALCALHVYVDYTVTLLRCLRLRFCYVTLPTHHVPFTLLRSRCCYVVTLFEFCGTLLRCCTFCCCLLRCVTLRCWLILPHVLLSPVRFAFTQLLQLLHCYALRIARFVVTGRFYVWIHRPTRLPDYTPRLQLLRALPRTVLRLRLHPFYGYVYGWFAALQLQLRLIGYRTTLHFTVARLRLAVYAFYVALYAFCAVTPVIVIASSHAFWLHTRTRVDCCPHTRLRLHVTPHGCYAFAVTHVTRYGLIYITLRFDLIALIALRCLIYALTLLRTFVADLVTFVRFVPRLDVPVARITQLRSCPRLRLHTFGLHLIGFCGYTFIPTHVHAA